MRYLSIYPSSFVACEINWCKDSWTILKFLYISAYIRWGRALCLFRNSIKKKSNADIYLILWTASSTAFKFYVYTVLKMISGRWRPLFSIHCVISLRGDLYWPARSPDLAHCDYFFVELSKITCLLRSL